MTPKLRLQIKKAPQRPGIYVFSAKDEVLYIGKAVNLRNRLKQYLNKKRLSLFMENMIREAEMLNIKTTDSEIEALILESQLIKKDKPKYNIVFRDDKQYFYVGFTKEDFPKIFITHQPRASGSCPSSPPQCSTAVCAPRGTPSRVTPRLIMHSYIGPFTDGLALKTTLKLLRRIFPYCTCKQPHNNYCLNYHIGKCLGYCCLRDTNSHDRKKVWSYQKNIHAIKDTLSGKKDSLTKKLRKELETLGKKQEFEKAIELRNKIKKLERVFENAKIINRGANDANVLIELKKMFKLSNAPNRIEGYDISNIQGKNAVGAMVVFIPVPSASGGATGQVNYQPDKNQYRKFKIRFKKEPDVALSATKNHAKRDDTAMLKEVLARRLNHPEWKYPDLIFIDGGIAQLNIAIKTTDAKFPIISLAKGKNEVFSSTSKKPTSLKKLPVAVQNLIRQIDAEAHRFAISYYRKIHRKRLIA